jgi:chromate reductase
MCGSLRKGSFNQSLLNAAIERAPQHGFEIVQADWSQFPLFSQDHESDAPEAVAEAKRVIQASSCILLVTPEYNHGVPGGLKNAVDWLSRPFGDTTLTGRPMALMGASSGYMGSIRAQMAWRQLWYFFRCPVFNNAELAVAFGTKAFDDKGVLIDPLYSSSLDSYLEALGKWIGAGKE